MFESLIESRSAANSTSRRSRYFALSGAAVAALAIAFLLFSLFAIDFEIGAEEFEMSTLLAPVLAQAPEPLPEPRQPQETVADVPIRRFNIARVDEIGPIPEKTSSVPNQYKARPLGRFIFGDGPEKDGKFIPGGNFGPGPTTGTGSSPMPAQPEVASVPPPKPPPTKPQPEILKRSSVINGLATFLPKPPYPTIALQLNLTGNVDVQVMIDETGRVASAKAVNGHPVLRGPAEKAALNARFEPTTINGYPVKVTGVIVYRFTRK